MFLEMVGQPYTSASVGSRHPFQEALPANRTMNMSSLFGKSATPLVQ